GDACWSCLVGMLAAEPAFAGSRRVLASHISASASAGEALTAMPNIPILSSVSQTMVRYSGCRLAKVAKPRLDLMSSISMTPPYRIAEAACSGEHVQQPRCLLRQRLARALLHGHSRSVVSQLPPGRTFRAVS